MSVQTIDFPQTQQRIQPPPAWSARAIAPPPLNAGDRLSRAEFERRYKAQPELKRAELIEGVVHLPAPVHFKQHGHPHYNLIVWLGAYTAATPGVSDGDNATVRLDFENEVQPDILLRLESAMGGRSRLTNDDYIEGPPDLVVGITANSAAYDLHDKRRVYARSGVQEYIVAQAYEQRLDWFVLWSERFPGLWLQAQALWEGDLAAMLATLQLGLALPDHTAWVGKLAHMPIVGD
jgi:Uma2 family endonuclease